MNDRERELLDKVHVHMKSISDLIGEFKEAQQSDKLPSFVGCQIDFQRHTLGLEGDIYIWNPKSKFGFTLYKPHILGVFIENIEDGADASDN